MTRLGKEHSERLLTSIELGVAIFMLLISSAIGGSVDVVFLLIELFICYVMERGSGQWTLFLRLLPEGGGGQWTMFTCV